MRVTAPGRVAIVIDAAGGLGETRVNADFVAEAMQHRVCGLAEPHQTLDRQDADCGHQTVGLRP